MAQERENVVMKPDMVQLIPKASTDIKPGDVLVMARKPDVVSIAALGTPGRVLPIAAAREGQWVVGVSQAQFTSAAVGATLYATPTQAGGVAVQRNGIVRLALTATSGKAGDAVVYSSGAAGAQLFAINNTRQGHAVARVWKDFSGASANDPQYCELIVVPLGGPNIYHWLENRVLEGCWVGLAAAPTTQVMIGKLLVGTVPAQNMVIIQNKLCSLARAASTAFGGSGSAASSSFRAKYIVARSGGFGIRSCSGTKAALASYTVAGVTIGLLTPTTMTAGEIPIALLIQFSAATQSAARIKNLRGPGLIPPVGSWGV